MGTPKCSVWKTIFLCFPLFCFSGICSARSVCTFSPGCSWDPHASRALLHKLLTSSVSSTDADISMGMNGTECVLIVINPTVNRTRVPVHRVNLSVSHTTATSNERNITWTNFSPHVLEFTWWLNQNGNIGSRTIDLLKDLTLWLFYKWEVKCTEPLLGSIHC